MHSATQETEREHSFMQTDLIKQEEVRAKDVSDTMDLLKKTANTLERDTRAHETTIGDHDKGIAQTFELLAQTDAKLAAQEVATAGHLTQLTTQIEHIESRLNTTHQRHDAFTHEVDRFKVLIFWFNSWKIDSICTQASGGCNFASR
ncbi:hypothetical protein FI667_g17698, partial [Globisporangium splendens]